MSRVGLPLAGFQVIIIGRFWVIPEERVRNRHGTNRRRPVPTPTNVVTRWLRVFNRRGLRMTPGIVPVHHRAASRRSMEIQEKMPSGLQFWSCAFSGRSEPDEVFADDRRSRRGSSCFMCWS